MTSNSDNPAVTPVIGDPSFRFTATQDWFSHNIPHWTRLFPLVTNPKPRILEIGSWEGRSAVFVAENLCKDGGIVVCIDHFDLFHTEAGKDRYARIEHNLGLTGKRYRIVPQFSFPALVELLKEAVAGGDDGEVGYDWIYVDGSHRADDTLLDGELIWRLAKKDAVVIFDDYHWDAQPDGSMLHPKRGIDAFLQLHEGEYELLTKPEDYQVVLKKTCDMRIGFLLPDTPDTTPSTASLNAQLEYGINVATAADTLFAMPASVALASLVQHTPGRVSIYVVDCGLSNRDRDWIVQSIPKRPDVSVVFVPLKERSMGKRWGGKWAKVDLYDVLPVERVLYLDADTLVRADITPLWETDLGGMAMGACLDVGYPMGEKGRDRRPYFNSGVLLLDLTKVRSSVSDLLEACERVKTEGRDLEDQGALNEHFAGDWKCLSLEWNAQGLGTYATFYDPERREFIDTSQLEKPKIVHYTGPVHPTLQDVLNPWVQPYTAKPWGYAGSPGHPFRAEWFEGLPFCWKGYIRGEWRDLCEREKKKAMDTAKSEFESKLASVDF